MRNRLALGTAQFGLDYGIANSNGKVSFDTARNIVRSAKSLGVEVIDTAIAYGTSEETLGRIGVESVQVISKLPSLPHDVGNVSRWVHDQVEGSLQRLRIPSLAGLMLHRPAELSGPFGRAIFAALRDCQKAGLVGRIGYSIYDPSELDTLFDDYPPDILQAPLNVVDRRLVSSGWLRRLSQAGVLVHSRSAFLQGLLLMEPPSRPAAFGRWRDLWAAWEDYLNRANLSPLEACLAFALSHDQIDKVVVGVNSLEQFNQIATAAERRLSVDAPDSLSSADIDLVDPSRWSRQ